MKRALGAASVAVLLVSGIVFTGTASAGGSSPPCGATITTDTTLTSDVGPCPGTGLIVTGNDVTLDLNGHRVFGTAAQGNDAIGIYVLKATNSTVMNGTVEGFDAGVVVRKGADNLITRLTVQDNVGNLTGTGLYGDGIMIKSSVENTVRANTVQRNGPYSGISLVTEVRGANAIEPFVRDNLVVGNQVRNNNIDEICTEEAIQLGFCTPEQFGQPTFNENFGIKIEGPGAKFNTVLNNQVTLSGIHGIGVVPTCIIFNPPNIDCDGDENPSAVQNSDNRIVRNNASRNGVSPEGPGGGGSGIYVFQVGESIPPVRTLITQNSANNNDLNGINIDCGSTNNTITNNQAFGNNVNGVTAFDGRDQNVPPCPTAPPPCDQNTWRDNQFGTVNHPCVRGEDGGNS